MTKKQAVKIIEFIRWHYDCVSQEDWFDFCDMVIEAIVQSANKGGYARSLTDMYPDFFEMGE